MRSRYGYADCRILLDALRHADFAAALLARQQLLRLMPLFRHAITSYALRRYDSRCHDAIYALYAERHMPDASFIFADVMLYGIRQRRLRPLICHATLMSAELPAYASAADIFTLPMPPLDGGRADYLRLRHCYAH